MNSPNWPDLPVDVNRPAEAAPRRPDCGGGEESRAHALHPDASARRLIDSNLWLQPDAALRLALNARSSSARIHLHWRLHSLAAAYRIERANWL